MRKDRHGKLVDMDIDEVSVVTKPANKRKFLFYKNTEELENAKPMFEKESEIDLEITSNGTREGTILKLNGTVVPTPEAIWFSLYEVYEKPGTYRVEASYTQKENVDGIEVSQTYMLRKENTMIDSIIDQLKEMFGKDFEVEQVEKNEETLSTLIKALEVTDSYKSDFPEELGNALTILAKYALSGYVVEKEVEQKPEDEGAEKQESEDEKPEEAEKQESEEEKPEEDTTNATEVDKSAEIMEGVSKVAESVSTISKSIEKITEAIGNLEERIETVEKTVGTSKQVTEDEAPEFVDPYPSLG